MKKMFLILCTNVIFSQGSVTSRVVASGDSNITIGAIFPIIDGDTINNEITLSTPKYEIPVVTPKPTPKKKTSLLEKILEFLKNIFK